MTAKQVARVAVAAPLGKLLSYAIPPQLAGRARVGVRLKVPLGRRPVVGYLLELDEAADVQGLKPVTEVLDDQPLFPKHLVAFYLRAADYYRHPPGEVIRTALPAGLAGGKGGVGILREKVYRPTTLQDEPKGTRQREILDWVRQEGPLALGALRERFPSPYGPLARLVELGFLSEEEQERRRDPFLDLAPPEDRPVEATPEQQAALESLGEALLGGEFAPFLLHGVTGSGKTEIYLRAIDQAIGQGRQALVLVPEISLTPQLVGRFRARFASLARIAVLHSGLSDGERYDAWRSIAAGEVDIVIGARSAVFAPLDRLGILVVDEEHEASYKQAEGFRYHARDLALMRGQMEQAVVLMGSATPALTTYYRSREGLIGYLPLTGRALDRPLPDVTLVDLTEAAPEGVLSESLAAALVQNLERGEQSVLLLNRRGFAPFLLCADCGETFRCPNCEITLTYYQGRRMLRCHYCDYAVQPPELCPSCRSDRIEPEGAGTERLEEELSALLPDARIARMDRDTTARKGAHQKLVEAMESRRIDILVGTQMVAKGHDFPGVTLVGVIGADSSLNFPDFRSAERTFALLTQVAGRAGRGSRPGRVLIQTYAADHYALECAASHDYQSFYEQEIAFRRELGYPPFGFLVNLVLAGNEAAKVTDAAQALAQRLEAQAGGVEVLGPAPCPLARRMQILLKANFRPPLRRLLALLEALPKKVPSAVSLAVDVDPVDML